MKMFETLVEALYRSEGMLGILEKPYISEVGTNPNELPRLGQTSWCVGFT